MLPTALDGDPLDGTRHIIMSARVSGLFTSWPYRCAIIATLLRLLHSSLSNRVEHPTTGTCWNKNSGSLVCQEALSSILVASSIASGCEPLAIRFSSSAYSQTEGIRTDGRRTPAVAHFIIKEITDSKVIDKSSTESMVSPLPFGPAANRVEVLLLPVVSGTVSCRSPTSSSNSPSPSPVARCSVRIGSDLPDQFVTPPPAVMPRSFKVYVVLCCNLSIVTIQRCSDVTRTDNDLASKPNSFETAPQASERCTSYDTTCVSGTP
mmetsp:Transcript_12352/g.28040  ORF Transcript_12352/g.28040 Transcript_12352/m.28040 type:complete len:264 (+) Transcript_12352:1644-2435(+)